MTTGVLSWSKITASNASADANVNFAEGQSAPSLNNSCRAAMASVAMYRDDISGMITLGGGTTAYTLTTNQTITLTDGVQVAFTVNSTNTGASTLNVDSTGDVALQKIKGTDLLSGELVAGCVYTATYDSASTAAWVIHGGVDNVRTPPGIIAPYAGTSAPTGWLLCYGQAISRTTYAALFAAISTEFGTGDGSTTFNIPDLRGRVIAGQDDMGGSSANRLTGLTDGVNGDTFAATGGLESTVLTEAQLPTITPAGSLSITSTLTSLTLDSRADYANGGGSRRVAQVSGTSGNTEFLQGSSITSTGTFSGTSFGSGSAHNNVQPTIILNYIIKY